MINTKKYLDEDWLLIEMFGEMEITYSQLHSPDKGFVYLDRICKVKTIIMEEGRWGMTTSVQFPIPLP